MQSGARQGCLQLLLHTKGHVSLHAAPCWPICSHPSPSNSLSKLENENVRDLLLRCLLYTSPSPRD